MSGPHLSSRETVLRREGILSAVTFASNVLLQSANWKDALNPALESLGKAAMANRAYYFENHTADDGEVLTSQLAEWVAEGIEPQLHNPDLQDFPYVAAGLGRWVEVMNQHKPIHGLISSFPDTERPIFEGQGIQSLVAMPVFSEGKLVGFLGFDDCESLRQWSSPEFDALLAAATALGAAMDRQSLEQQLRFSQKMEAIGILASGVAHDFNNMLQVIVGFASIAKLKDATTNALQAELDEILAASDRAHNLTRQLLSFSRKQNSRPQSTSVKAVCDSVVTMVKPMLGGDINLIVEVVEPSPVIFVDASSFCQVLLNLCMNACDAMPSGGQLKIQATTVEIDELLLKSRVGVNAGTFVCITVSDTGCGMTDEVMSRIFEPFFTTKVIGKGTGLGLSVVYGCVQQGGGFIDVHSKPHMGSQFHIHIPLAESPESVPERAVSFTQGSETILLVDDEPMVLDSARRLLQAAGYQVLVADNGMRALEVYKRHANEISLVLTDYLMPAMDGLALIHAIRTLNPAAKVILISGNPSAASQAADRQNIVLLQKPVSNSRLQQTIRSLLG